MHLWLVRLITEQRLNMTNAVQPVLEEPSFAVVDHCSVAVRLLVACTYVCVHYGMPFCIPS